jgi:hypothetical protein
VSTSSLRWLTPDGRQERGNWWLELVAKKMGCSSEHPVKPFGRNYRFFAAFFFAPLAAFFAIVLS